MARIDIWMPAWNAAATIDAALRSVRRQTFRDWRLLAVDDGSTDDTTDRIARAADEDPRIRLHRTVHGGIVAALRAAASRSDAPLVARMDADDLCHRRRLEAQLEVEADVVATRVRVTGGDGMKRYLRWQNALTTHEQIVRSLFVECPIAHPTVLMRRRALEEAGGYREVEWPEDYDLWLRLRAAGATFAKVPRPLLAWRDSPRRLTRTHAMYSERAHHAVKVHYLLRDPIVRRGLVTVWGAGPIGRRWARDLRAAGIPVQQMIDIDPRKIGRRVAGGIPVVEPEPALKARRGPVLGAVGSRGARDLIRPRLLDAGLVEGADFLFVA